MSWLYAIHISPIYFLKSDKEIKELGDQPFIPLAPFPTTTSFLVVWYRNPYNDLKKNSKTINSVRRVTTYILAINLKITGQASFGLKP